MPELKKAKAKRMVEKAFETSRSLISKTVGDHLCRLDEETKHYYRRAFMGKMQEEVRAKFKGGEEIDPRFTAEGIEKLIPGITDDIKRIRQTEEQNLESDLNWSIYKDRTELDRTRQLISQHYAVKVVTDFEKQYVNNALVRYSKDIRMLQRLEGLYPDLGDQQRSDAFSRHDEAMYDKIQEAKQSAGSPS